MNELSIFDFLPEEEAERFRPQKATDWKWTFADYPQKKNGLKVFSFFACGGGSTMGYKLAGCEVLGCCEIDHKMNEIYVKNHSPKYNFLMDIRDFNKIPDSEIPAELFNLDILDGSPPCTTFSMAGNRETGWGKKKKFREGQSEQTLDDLPFVFIDSVRKLNPRTVIMENVEGLLLGEAWKYVQSIYAEFKKAGYKLHHWLLKGENMGIPQRRHRVFFIAIRNDLNINPGLLDMTFHYDPVAYGEIMCGNGKPLTEWQKHLLEKAQYGDSDLGEINLRLYGRCAGFSDYICWNDRIMNTITSSGKLLNPHKMCHVSDEELVLGQTFPADFDFCDRSVRYVCGMSVPPVMIKRIVQRLLESGVL